MGYWERQRNLFTLAYEAKNGLRVDEGEGLPGDEVWSSLIPRYVPLAALAGGREPVVTNPFDGDHEGLDYFFPWETSDPLALGYYTGSHLGRVWYPVGTRALAASDGHVVAAGLSSRGHYVVIEHANEDRTGYSHGQDLLVSVGDDVKGGQDLFMCGWDLKWSKEPTENNPVHLHFLVKRNGVLIDPARWLRFAKIKPAE